MGECNSCMENTNSTKIGTQVKNASSRWRTSDGLNLYFSALTAHFGHWLQVGRQGRKALRWQVAPELISGQVKKSYRRRNLVRVTPTMRLGTEAALKVVLEGLGHSVARRSRMALTQAEVTCPDCLRAKIQSEGESLKAVPL